MSPAPPKRWTIFEHRGPDALKALEADWGLLYDAMERRTAFHAYDAHRAYLDHLMATPERFRCLVLRDADEAKAICPLEYRTDRVLGLPLHVWGTPFGPHWPLSDVICPEGDTRAAIVPAIVEYLRRRSDGVPLLVFGPLPATSTLWHGLQGVGAARHCAQITSEPFVFDCRRPFDELTGRLSKHFRKQLRNYRNRLTSLADVRFETGDGESTPLLEAFLEVEASGWKGEAGTGSAIRLDPSRLAFYRRLAQGFADGDGCEVNALFAEGRCIAAEYCVRTGDEYACLKIGYDERYARVSPGHLLHARTLERCCQDPGIARYNQLSDAAWLGVWHPDKVALRKVYVPLGRFSGVPLAAALLFRFGTGRRLARRIRARRDARRSRSAMPKATNRSEG